MAPLHEKIQHALDESRLLILGAQVLIGVHSRAAFERGCERFSWTSQALLLGALALLLLALALLLWLAAYHRLVAAGQDTEALQQCVTTVLAWALLPCAVSLAIDLGVATARFANPAVSPIAGLTTLLVALWWWYGLAVLRRRQRRARLPASPARRPALDDSRSAAHTPLARKIQHVLTRVCGV
jgi:hypothetical protein